MFRTKRFQLVELVIPATVVGNNQQTYFQNQPQLQSISGDRRIYVKKITAYTDESIDSSPLTSGNPIATAADLINAVLVLSVQGENAFNMVPLSDLSDIAGAASATPYKYFPFLLKNTWRLDWTKSYIQTITAPVAVPFSYLLGVSYDYEPDYMDMSLPAIYEFFDYATAISDYPLTVNPKDFGYGR